MALCVLPLGQLAGSASRLQIPTDSEPVVGFFGGNVRSMSGNFQKSDINSLNKFNSLDGKCRVFTGERVPENLEGVGGEKSGVWVWTPNGLQNPLF
jgi:hypothetical protein